MEHSGSIVFRKVFRIVTYKDDCQAGIFPGRIFAHLRESLYASRDAGIIQNIPGHADPDSSIARQRCQDIKKRVKISAVMIRHRYCPHKFFLQRSCVSDLSKIKFVFHMSYPSAAGRPRIFFHHYRKAIHPRTAGYSFHNGLRYSK